MACDHHSTPGARLANPNSPLPTGSRRAFGWLWVVVCVWLPGVALGQLPLEVFMGDSPTEVGPALEARWADAPGLIGDLGYENDRPGVKDPAIRQPESLSFLSGTSQSPGPWAGLPRRSSGETPTGPQSASWLSPSGQYEVGGVATCSECGGPVHGAPSGLWPRDLLWRLLGVHCQNPGQPVSREDWLFRPYSAGFFMGAMDGGRLIDDWLDQEWGYFAGYRVGWDSDRWWGYEMRLGFGSVQLIDSQRAKDAQQAQDDAAGLPPDDPFRQRFDHRRDSNVILWDIHMLYYPLGDTRWRPYLLAGVGTARIDFADRLSRRWDKTFFVAPLGFGLKYRCSSRTALRFQCLDNLVFGNGGIKNQHNWSATAGLEIRLGGTRKAYWPWNPGRHYW